MIPVLFRRLLSWCSNGALRLVAALALSVLPMSPAAAANSALDRPMEFVLVHGSAGYCRGDGSCADWIAAEGQITAATPKRLQKILKSLGGRKLPIIVRSPGGDVAAAMQMGLTIRQKGLSVAIGGSRLADCPVADPLCKAARQKDGSARGAVYSSGAVCFSACPLLLAGGVRRVASPFALIGVHQITTTYREERVRYRTEYEMVNGRKKILSQKEIGRKLVGQHDTTRLDRKQKAVLLTYFKKMGVDAALFDLMMGTVPTSIHLIPQDEAVRIRMTTEQESADDLVLVNDCAGDRSIASCIAALHPATVPETPAAAPQPGSPQAAPQPVALPVTGTDEIIL